MPAYYRLPVCDIIRRGKSYVPQNDCITGMHVLINRVAAARGFLQRLEIDCILFSDLMDIRYLSGFSGSEGALLLADSLVMLFTDSRYTTQASAETSGCVVVEARDKAEAIASAVMDERFGSVGVQSERISLSFYNEINRLLSDVRLIPVDSETGFLRSVKDSGEMEKLANVAAIASESLMEILPVIRPGITEKTLASRLQIAMLDRGADDKSFDFIVASGERGALPHGRATDKTLRSGELLTIDFGALLDGYVSDETVTVAVGRADAKHREIYAIVKDAHDLALEAVKPGVPLKVLDSVAREYIAGKGFGEYFRHGLGHGVGMEVHEKPVVSVRSEGTVQEGMVFTIEPGIYLPGWGGVRIEDTVRVTSDGCISVTKVPKDMMIL